MTRARILQAVRQMRFDELCARRQQRTVTMAEAAEMLRVAERMFRRWSGRYGVPGVMERKVTGKPCGLNRRSH